MKKTNKAKFLVSILIPLSLLLTSCGDDSNQASGGSTGGGGTGGISLSYKNSRNGNALVSLANSSSFPTGSITAANKSNLGSFYQINSDCGGTSIPFNFTLKNNGISSVSATNSPAVTITDNTVYNWGSMSSGDVTYTLTTAPTFPLAAGASTDFTITVSTTNNSICTYGETTFVDDATTAQKFEVVVHTNDATSPNYSVDFTLYGNS